MFPYGMTKVGAPAVRDAPAVEWRMGGAMIRIMLIAATLALSFGSTTAEAAPRRGKPDLGKCPSLQPLEQGQIGRTDKVMVPRMLSKVARADEKSLAVGSWDGATVCVDVRLMGDISNLTLSEDSRFLSFKWAGYEADGFVMVDRTGAGQAIDTGMPPVFSPSRMRFASVHQSESAFNEQEGLGVWQIDPVGTKALVQIAAIPEMLDWRVDGWSGEDCINLSAIPFWRAPKEGTNYAGITRDRYTARAAGNGWRVVKSIGRGC
jgi:hypothetical protein